MAEASDLGDSKLFNITLNSQPDGDVVVDIVVTDAIGMKISPSRFIFTMENWSKAQEVTVTGMNNEEYTMRTVVDTVSTTDTTGYNELREVDISVRTLSAESESRSSSGSGSCFIGALDELREI